MQKVLVLVAICLLLAGCAVCGHRQQQPVANCAEQTRLVEVLLSHSNAMGEGQQDRLARERDLRRAKEILEATTCEEVAKKFQGDPRLLHDR